MSAEAIAKLRTEMDANKANSYVQVVGQFLIDQVNANPPAAEKILVADKTILGSLSEMQKEAQKKKSGNFAVLTDQEGFSIVLKYFGIGANGPVKASAPVETPKPDTQSSDFNISLDDLLGV